MTASKLGLGLVLLALLGAGCAAEDNPTGAGDKPLPDPVETDRPEDPGLSFELGCLASLPLDNILGGNLPPDAIRSLNQPDFLTAEEVDYLLPGDRVFGIEIRGRFLAFPRRILNYHEIVTVAVRDSGEVVNTVVSWCPLTFSFIEWRPRWDNPLQSPRIFAFGVSGGLMDNNLVMFDRGTRSTWSQILGLATSGPRAGECMEMGRNAVDTTWELWRRLHPETLVLTNETGVAGVPPHIYATNPYVEYWAGREELPWPVSHVDDRFDPQKVVLAVHGKEGSAVVLLTGDASSTGRVGGTPIVVFQDAATQTAFVFENALDGEELEFIPAPPGANGLPRFEDVTTGSRWTIDGISVEGPSAGRRLAQLPAFHLYWFAWAAFFPDQPVLRL